MSRKSIFKSSVASMLVFGALGGAQALAQDANQPAAEDEEEEIVVTGSRIRSEFNSPSPIQVITTEAANLAGISDASEMIQNSSLAAGSPQNDATISSAFVTDGGPGSQTVSLRGLGANRTLVLLNGRRAGPAGTRGAVSAFDLNVLPLSMINRVEVLKDGASSIYGSDAVAGVVNLITRTDVDGGEINLAYSLPMEDGGDELSMDGLWGRTFAGGHITAALDYYHATEIVNGSRDYTNCAVDRTFSVATGQRNDIIDPRTGQPACRGNTRTGLVWLYDYSGEGQFAPGANFIQYDGTGQLGTLVPASILPTPLSPFGPTAPANWFNVDNFPAIAGISNSNSPFEQNASLTPDIERTTAYVEGSFELAPNVEAYGEVLLNRRETNTNGFRQVWTYVYSYDYGDPFSLGWNGASILSPTPTTDHFDASQKVDYSRVIAGLRGDFAGPQGPINWDIYLQNSVSDASYTQDVILADAVYSSDGRSDFGTGGLFNANSIPRAGASCVGFNTPISNRPCVDVDWLSPTLMSGGGFSAAEEAFLYDVETGHTKYTQRYVEASITGDLFALPAGNVGGAFGVVYRTDEIDDVPGAVTLAGNSWGLSSAGITRGEDTTSEAFGEVLIPILRGAPLAESLQVTLSGRYTDVESFGSASTHKIGVNWQLTPEFRLHFTQGTSFRAPALFELFLADQTSFLGQRSVDPCINWGAQLAIGNISQRVADNCAFSGGPNPTGGIPIAYTGAGAGATIITGGGAGLLEAETSDARVIGLVWEPSWSQLSVAVDYFEIDVANEVARLGAGGIVFGCYNSLSFPTDPLCSLFDRGIGLNPNLINTVTDSYLNVNSQTNTGLDLTLRYQHEFPWGDFNMQSQVTWQFEDTIALFAGTTQDNNGNNGDPDVVGSVDLSLDRDDWTYFWRTSFVGTTSDREILASINSAGTTRFDIDGEFTAYHAASVRRDFDTWSLTAGVANILDQAPPTVSTVGGAGQSTIGPSLLASQYDYVGRRVFLRARKTF